MQIFGGGHVSELRMVSPIYDLGTPQHVYSIDWLGQSPENTNIAIRSRTGDQLGRRLIYYSSSGKEITERQWSRYIPQFRGSIDTMQTAGNDWSAWSRVYEIPGQKFVSPSPRRYLQLSVDLVSSDPYSAASLNKIELNYTDPIARQTYGEIYPTEVNPGEPTLFTYYLKAEFGSNSIGFDRLVFESTSQISLRELRLNGQRASVDIRESDGVSIVDFEKLIRDSIYIEVDFMATVYRQSNVAVSLSRQSSDRDITQLVDPGDANSKIASETTSIAAAFDRGLIGNVQLSSPIFTPNSDGIRDQLDFSIDVFQLMEARPLKIAVYNLAGEQIVVLREIEIVAGRVEGVWDGTDSKHRLVAPGIYILRIDAQGDALSYKLTRTIAVAY